MTQRDLLNGLLRELIVHRNKLLAQLAHPMAVGNFEEETYDPLIARLGAVQLAINAARDAMDRPHG